MGRSILPPCLLVVALGCGPQASFAPTSPNIVEVDDTDAAPTERDEPTDERWVARVLRPCKIDHVRQFLCGHVPETSATKITSCPSVATGLEDSHEYLPIWRSRPGRLEPDAALTSWHRSAAKGMPPRDRDCCYSSCVPVPVRAEGKPEYEYGNRACLPSMKTSYPARTRSDCPAAIAFAGDMPGHVAPFDEEGTREQLWRWGDAPLLQALSWCCYETAPAAVFGPR